jgi:hypothetical protein
VAVTTCLVPGCEELSSVRVGTLPYCLAAKTEGLGYGRERPTMAEQGQLFEAKRTYAPQSIMVVSKPVQNRLQNKTAYLAHDSGSGY